MFLITYRIYYAVKRETNKFTDKVYSFKKNRQIYFILRIIDRLALQITVALFIEGVYLSDHIYEKFFDKETVLSKTVLSRIEESV